MAESSNRGIGKYKSTAIEGRQHQPRGFKHRSFDRKPSLLRSLLVPDLQPPDLADVLRREGEVVVALRLRVHVLDDDVDCLPDITLLEIRVAEEVHVLEDLRGLEIPGQDEPRG